MIAYIVRRLLLVIPTVLGVMLLVFFLTRVAVRGDTVDIILSSSHSSDTADARQLRAKLGLDEPWYQQFWVWGKDVLRGDFGKSVISAQHVSDELRDRIPQTLELSLLATIFAIIVAIPIGVISATYQDSIPDYVLRGGSILLLAIPGFWLATLVIVIGSLYFSYTPPLETTGFTHDPLANLKQMWLPAFLLGVSTGATLMRMVRTTVLEALRQDYMRTARAKGLSSRIVITRHALRNALIPVVTVLGIQVGAVLGGSVIFEQIFAINGIGRYLFESMNNRDYTAIQGITLVLASTVILINLLVDLSYAYLDPRIRYR